MKRILVAVVLAVSLSVASAADFEFGVEYDASGVAPYIYATHDFLIWNIESWDSGVWFSPSVEVVFGSPIRGFAQAQFLFDTPSFTVSVRGSYDTATDRFFARAGVLIGR